MNRIKLTTARRFVISVLMHGFVKNLFFLAKEMRMQPFVGKFTLAAILILSTIAIVGAQGSGYSTTAIDIREFSFTPSTIDTTNGSQTVTITVRVTDTERDFKSMYAVFKSPRIGYGFDFAVQDRISGDGRDGVYQKTFTFFQYAEAGTWEVDHIFVYDGTAQYYRWRRFNTSELAARGFAVRLSVINNNEAVPPEISEFNFTPSGNNTTGGSRNVTISLRAKDEASGVSSISVGFSNPPDCYFYDDDCVRVDFPVTAADRISGDAKNGVYRVVVHIPQSIPVGIYSASVFASDAVRNFTSLNPADLAARGFPSQLRIAGTTRFDYDGDGRADLSVFRTSDRTWYLNRSQAGFAAAQFGLATDKITPADFDGDGRTDIAVFRDGVWYWLNSSNGGFNAFQFGLAGDVPVPADYTGDGRADLAVYRAGVWFTLDLTNNQSNAAQFGNATDKPVPADFDADGKTDFAVYRDGTWHLLRSTDGFDVVQFGLAQDKPVVGDYDGDGRADAAVYRSGVWYVLGSSQGFSVAQFGLPDDVPTPADYDGDGKTDFAVYRNGTWYLQNSQQGFAAAQFGLTTDKPVPAAFAP